MPSGTHTKGGSGPLVAGLKANLGTSLASRVLTFVLNVLLVRRVDREAYGVGFVSFQLFNSLGLFLLKEGFRRAAMRRGAGSPGCTGRAETALNEASAAAAGNSRPGDDRHERVRGSFRIVWLGIMVTAGVNAVLFMVWVGPPLVLRAPLRAGVGFARSCAWTLLASLHPNLAEAVLGPDSGETSAAASTGSAVGASTPEEPTVRFEHTLALLFMCLGNMAEACTEPVLVAEALELRLNTKPFAEAVCWTSRTALLCGLVVLLDVDFVLAFALAHLFGALAYAYCFAFLRSVHAETATAVPKGPAVPEGSRAIDVLQESLAALSAPQALVGSVFQAAGDAEAEVTLQVLLLACQKVVLAEGEKILLMLIFDIGTRGVYAVVSNLGSLVLRTLFAPVEEIAYSYFSAGGATAVADDDNSEVAGVATQQGPPKVATSLLALQGLVGLLGVLYGPANCFLAIRSLYGLEWAANAEAVLALRVYCGFLFASALNGILEAYVHAVADVAWLRQNLRFQCFCSVSLCAVGWALRGWASAGLVVANAVCMVLRILRCVTFASTGGGPSCPPPGSRAALGHSWVRWWHPALTQIVPSACATAAVANGLLWRFGFVAPPDAGSAGFAHMLVVHIGVCGASLVGFGLLCRCALRELVTDLLQVRAEARSDGGRKAKSHKAE